MAIFYENPGINHMDAADVIEYCLAKPAVTESYPFGPNTLVLKVCDKIFALFSLDSDTLRVNLKCDPRWAEELREEWPEIIPGYHMNKKHWNTVDLEGSLPHHLIKKMADHSYQLVVASLPAILRQSLQKSTE